MVQKVHFYKLAMCTTCETGFYLFIESHYHTSYIVKLNILLFRSRNYLTFSSLCCWLNLGYKLEK